MKRTIAMIGLGIVAVLLVLVMLLIPVMAAQAQTTETPTATATATATATPTMSAPIAQDLISCWTMDEASGTRYDSAGSNDLTDNNTVGSVAGKFGNAASFIAGNNEYLSHTLNDDLDIGTKTWTLGLWVKSNTDSGKVFSEGVILHFYKAYIWYWDWYSGSLMNYGVVPDSWNYIVLSRNYSNRDTTLQVNGNTRVVASLGNPQTSGYTWNFGKREYSSASYFTGEIDEPSFWDRELTEGDRLWLYNAGSGRSCEDILAEPTPTPTATPSGSRKIELSSGDWATLERTVNYGDVALVGVIGLLLIVIVIFSIGYFGEKWFN